MYISSKPLISQFDSLFQCYISFPSHTIQMGYIKQFLRRPIRLRGIENYFPLITYNVLHQFSKLRNADVLTNAYIDKIAAVMRLHQLG